MYIICDHYRVDSIKSGTRDAMIGLFQRTLQLTLQEESYPLKKYAWHRPKHILIEIIYGELCKRFLENHTTNRIVVTSGSPVPEEIPHGQQIRRNDLVSYYEKADNMIP